MKRVLLLLLFIWADVISAVEIKRVYHEPLRIDYVKGEMASVHFHLTRPAQVDLRIYDGRDRLVRRITSPGELGSGDHSLPWEGRDESGRLVPEDAYHYTLRARDAEGNEVIHDLTDITGGHDVFPTDVRWDAVLQRIEYVLPGNARVSIRLWLQHGGPYLGTVVDWAPRAVGKNSEPWHGLDVSGVMDLRGHPSLEFMVQAYALSDNTILVGGAASKGQWVEDLSWEVEPRSVAHTKRPRMSDYSQKPIETRGDVRLTLRLAADVPVNDAGLPVITSQVPLQLDVVDEYRPHLVARRMMTAFFIDGQFVHENKTGYLPMTWHWDPRGANRGVHYITANVYGYEGNLGAATLKVYVDPAQRTTTMEE